MKLRKTLFFLAMLLLTRAPLFAQSERSTTKKIDKAISLINTQYVDTVNMPYLVEQAIKAMINELDPHSKYLSAKELKKNNEALYGSFAGIGIHYQILNDTLLILSTTPQGPAETAGIKAGDKIISIDGQSCTGPQISNSFLSKQLRGKAGTRVKVGIKHRHNKKPETISIIRGKIPINTLGLNMMLDNKTAYIKINGFSFTTLQEFQLALLMDKTLGMKNLIIDLRGNPGGLMMASINLADEFLDGRQLIVYTEGEHYQRSNYYSKEGGAMIKGRLIVLLDEWSASASEIFAGAIQDLDRGLIAGRRSYGKGLVGRNFILPDGSAIRLTTGHYYTPSGRCIQKPYNRGFDAYKKDLLHRLQHGELSTADSIHFPDSLKYQTLGGRTVYGGGGIMPDLFFAKDTTSPPDCYRQLISKGIINAFAGLYFDQHLDRLLSRYPDIESYEKNFSFNDSCLTHLTAFAQERYHYHTDEQCLSSNADKICFELKALLARNLYENGAYYRIKNQEDPMISNCLKIINKPKVFKEHGVQYR